VFDFGVTADQIFYYVMELLAGRDLQSLVREFGPVSAGRALFLLRQVCHSLAEAHARGLVHRDVTPSNIYVCRMGLDYDFVEVLCRCRSGEGWDNESARTWWERHLVELAGPPDVTDALALESSLIA